MDAFSVESDGRFFRITLKSNDRLDGTGFRASYVFEPAIMTTEPHIVEASDIIDSKRNFSSKSHRCKYFNSIICL